MPGFMILLDDWRLFILALHVLGTCLGLGGATIADLLFFRFLRDARISPKEASVLRLIGKIVISAMIFIILTGLLLFLPAGEIYIAKPPFMFKMIVVLILSINGLLLHVVVAPHLLDMCFVSPGTDACVLHRGWKRLAFALGAISMTSWYTAFFTAMLKSIMTAPLWVMTAAYFIVLATAVSISQLAEAHFENEARRNTA